MGVDSVDYANDSEAATELLDPLVLRARSRVGEVLRGKWRLDVLLGVGGMAAVYAGTHRNGSRGAIKILHSELSINPQVRSRFQREGQVANAVGHEGAVRVIDDDVAEDGSLFMVTELLDGETLEDRRVRFGGRLPEDEVLCAADQLLAVLAAAHAQGVVHRDVKPENVFLTRDGRVRLLDFGIARLRELSTASTATRSGSSMGTPAYMAPEQARGLWDEVDARSDLWAVGATMFHLLTGRLVHDGRTTNEQLIAAATAPARPLASVLPTVAPTVAHVIDRGLAFDRDKRWPSAERMQEAARHAYHDRHGAPLSTAPRLTVPETVPNRTLAGALGAMAPRLPTTGQPLSRSAGATGAGGASPGVLAGLVVGGAVVVGLVVVGVAWAVASPSRASAVAAPGPSVTVGLPPSPSVASAPLPPAASSPPPVAATDLPAAPRPAPPAPLPPRAPTSASSVAPPAPAAGPPQPNCSPPYTLDPATGKKNWKVECL